MEGGSANEPTLPSIKSVATPGPRPRQIIPGGVSEEEGNKIERCSRAAEKYQFFIGKTPSTSLPRARLLRVIVDSREKRVYFDIVSRLFLTFIVQGKLILL